MSDSNILWTACSALLRAQITDGAWHTWFEAVQPASIEGDTLLLTVPSTLAKERIEQRYRAALHQAVEQVNNHITNVRLDVRPHVAPLSDLDSLPSFPPEPISQLGTPGPLSSAPPVLPAATTNLDK
ncbi:MAG: hypothetical protein J2P59_05925, partial [Acidimicrobiales bacterium]|nr:hypothetical protein [Acidimicrobiales bacterium]